MGSGSRLSFGDQIQLVGAVIALALPNAFPDLVKSIFINRLIMFGALIWLACVLWPHISAVSRLYAFAGMALIGSVWLAVYVAKYYDAKAATTSSPLVSAQPPPSPAPTSALAPTPVAPSIVFLYKDHRIEINNMEKSELPLWGTKLDQGPVSMERKPTILPIQPYNYHVNANSFEEEVLAKFGPDGEVRAPFTIFVKDAGGRKWKVICELWTVVKKNQLTVETRNLGYEAGWGKNQVTPEPQKQASLKFSFLPLKPHEEMVYAADSPLASGVVSVAFTAKNIGTVQADNGQIWIQLCDGCRFASEPEGSNAPPDDPTVRRKRFDRLHIGVYFDSTVLKIIPPADSSYFTIVFKYACEQCPEIDNKNPQTLRVNVLR